MITQALLTERYEYKDGVLYWKYSIGGTKSGTRAGFKADKGGYYKIWVDKKRYQLHRIIFLHQKGYLPKYIDHKDGNPANNSIDNLRPATMADNARNRVARKGCISKYKGVGWNRKMGKWEVGLTVNYKHIYVGLFESEEEAANAYIKEAEKHYGEFATQRA